MSLTKQDLTAITDLIKKSNMILKEEIKEDIVQFKNEIHEEIVEFKDEILKEIRDLRDDVAVVTGYRDQIEVHETRLNKIDKHLRISTQL